MPRPTIPISIPLHKDIKSIKTLMDEGYSQREIAEYYGVPIRSIKYRIKKMRES